MHKTNRYNRKFIKRRNTDNNYKTEKSPISRLKFKKRKQLEEELDLEMDRFSLNV